MRDSRFLYRLLPLMVACALPLAPACNCWGEPQAGICDASFCDEEDGGRGHDAGTTPDGGPPPGDAGPPDAGPQDAGSILDAGGDGDGAGVNDGVDAGLLDAGPAHDAGVLPDAGASSDAGFTLDAGGGDAGPEEADAGEGGPPDAGTSAYTLSVSCDISAGTGSQTVTLNGVELCSVSGAAPAASAGSSNMLCSPGDDITLSATCTATSCRVFVSSQAPDLGLDMWPLGGPGGYSVAGSVTVACP